MAIKDELRTQKAVIWWRWWDEARHKSSPEKRLAFYDALMAYIFLGERPEDPLDMENPTGVDWAAYDASHYFDIIDASIATGGEEGRPRGGQIGNQNARKNKSETNKNESQNESETNKNESQNEKTNPLRKKNEERRMKNEEERERDAHAQEDELICDDERTEIIQSKSDPIAPPSMETVLAVARDGSKRSSGETIPDDFAMDWFDIMQTSEWRDTKGQLILPHGWKGKLAFAWRDEKRRRQDEAAKGKNRKSSSPSNIHHDSKVEVQDAF